MRRSCQTIARWIGSPVERSQTTTVSRWLVMPIAATSAAFRLRRLERLDGHVALARPDFLGIVLDPAGLRKVLLEFALSDGDDFAGLVEDNRPREVVP